MAAEDRLRWRCRRGLLELDLALQAFYEAEYGQLEADQREAFERLLGYPDPALLGLLTGAMSPADRELADVVARIRTAAASLP